MIINGRILTNYFEVCEYLFGHTHLKKGNDMSRLYSCKVLFIDLKINKLNDKFNEFYNETTFDSYLADPELYEYSENVNITYIFYISNFDLKELEKYDEFMYSSFQFAEHCGDRKVITKIIVPEDYVLPDDAEDFSAERYYVTEKTKEILKVFIPKIDALWKKLKNPENHITFIAEEYLDLNMEM